jgi:F0F1-type ATP synthase assembly protein I
MLYFGPVGVRCMAELDESGRKRRKLGAVIGLEVGLTFTVTVVGLFYLGFIADERLGTKPLWSLVGFAVGFLVGFYNLFLTLDSASKKAKQERDEAKARESEDGDAT